jgi:diguanylate cyclase (GGDEF)-like protein
MPGTDSQKDFMERTLLAVMGVPLVGLLDYWTGYGLQVSILYLIPVFGAAWYCGLWPGVGISVLTGIMSLVVDVEWGHSDAGLWVSLWNACMRVWLYFPVAYLAAHLRMHLDRERQFARVDPLTGILNGRAFSEEAERFLALTRRKEQPLTVVYIDLDDFKGVNDSRGHSGGDKVLREVAQALVNCTRPYDLVARMGGDEFCVLLPDTGVDEAKGFMAQASEKLEREAELGGWQASFSVGVATFRIPPMTLDTALSVADDLMYQAKRAGKRRVLYGEWSLGNALEAEIREPKGAPLKDRGRGLLGTIRGR